MPPVQVGHRLWQQGGRKVSGDTPLTNSPAGRRPRLRTRGGGVIREVFAHGWKTTNQFNRFRSERKDFGRVENHAEPVFGSLRQVNELVRWSQKKPLLGGTHECPVLAVLSLRTDGTTHMQT